MANNYTTPGVYVEEIPSFPPGIVEIQSAVPVFIGLTAQTTINGQILSFQPVLVENLQQFQTIFGGPPPLSIASSAFASSSGSTIFADSLLTLNGQVTLSTYLPALLFHSMELYFANGGGPCYVSTIGTYGTKLSKDLFTQAIDALTQYPDPTLIVMPDAVLLSQDDFFVVMTHALNFVSGSIPAAPGEKYRFVIMDLQEYGAPQNPKFSYTTPTPPYYQAFRDNIGSNNLAFGAAYTPYIKADVNPTVYCSDVLAAFKAWQKASKSSLTLTPPGKVVAPTTPGSRTDELSLRALWPNYKSIAEAIESQPVLLPPSGAIAGIYFATDAARGEWKAPANVTIANATDVAYLIDEYTNGVLNVDATAGRSINAIRSFKGYGITVWGARTLAGNDTDWRYVPVRRTASIIEQSIKISLRWAVFEPNDDHLWVRVKGAITTFLTERWKEGSLQGSTPDKAFTVNVGLGSTMTAQDLLDGKLIVTVGIALVHPAEFVILRFNQQLAQA